MPLPNFSDSIGKNIIRHIKYRGTIRTAEVIADNDDGTYDVKIALSDETYPNVETIHYDMVFNVGEIAVLAFEYGSKELPKIIGHGKKVAQDPVEVEVDYSGIARVETLNAYTITATTAYLEGRISLGGAGNCKTRGFEYGITTAYGNDTHTDGSYGDGSYAIQITGLTEDTTYHFRAYVIDENGDTLYGNDKTFKTLALIDIGSPAILRLSALSESYTRIEKDNPANATGKITSIEIWANTNLSTCIVATFYCVSGNNFSTRDYKYIGDVTAGSKQTFDVNLDVQVGDYIGIYWGHGNIAADIAGYAGVWYKSGNNIPCTNETFTLHDGYTLSLYGTGLQ